MGSFHKFQTKLFCRKFGWKFVKSFVFFEQFGDLLFFLSRNQKFVTFEQNTWDLGGDKANSWARSEQKNGVLHNVPSYMGMPPGFISYYKS